MDIPMVAGAVSTVLFAAANLPMVVKAVRTRDLRSYSGTALILGNVGNVVHTIYVVSLPWGPIWVLHGFYLVSMGVMLALFTVVHRRPHPFRRSDAARGPGDGRHESAAAAHGGADRRAGRPRSRTWREAV
ncbi:hypothetical protein K0817_015525 [Microbacterium sp. HD4P20]|uniref:hypothetical protein n=1 Tax=Microbacterium sp. HD4P20 TaxID=2864874 RepID=UPI001C644B07|nr:hypothetical protein [Microbacterium sp. HD4P20]MCP2637962.1 hypothetical protein [Microbacterium sp. HD4P20]